MDKSRWSAVVVMLGIGWLLLSCASPKQTVVAKPTTPPVAPAAGAPESDNAFSGTIVQINRSAHLLTVKSASGQQDFVVGRKTEVFTETSKHGALSTLNVGDLVDVFCERHDAVTTATRIVRTAVAAGRKPAPEVERLERMLNPDPNNPYDTN